MRHYLRYLFWDLLTSAAHALHSFSLDQLEAEAAREPCLVCHRPAPDCECTGGPTMDWQQGREYPW